MPPATTKVSREPLFARLAQIEKDSDRRKFLSRHKSLVHSDVLKQLADLVLEKIRVNTHEALHLADAGLVIARKLRGQEHLAMALRAKANALYACGENRAAVQHHDRASAMYEALELWKDAARTHNSSIQPLILLGG